MVTAIAHLRAISVFALVLVWVLHFREGLAFRTHDKLKIFNVHPLLMVRFIVLVGEAILVQKTLPGTRRVHKGVHLMLHLSALIVGGIEFLLSSSSTKSSVFHMSILSIHGLAFLPLACFACKLCSFSTFAYPQLKASTRSAVVPYHVVGGILLFLLAVSTAFVGLGEKFIYLKLQCGQEALVVNFTGLLLLLFAVSVPIKVLVPRVYQST